jgi:hypothetical protein
MILFGSVILFFSGSSKKQRGDGRAAGSDRIEALEM